MAGRHRAGRDRFWQRAPRGRANQADGRHTPDYVAMHMLGPYPTGMFPLGNAQRHSLSDFLAADDTVVADRGDRHSWTPPGQEL